MKRTISVMLFKREDYSRQVLEHIGAAKGVDDWEVNVFCDNPGHNKLVELAESFDFVNKVYLAPTKRGLKKANQWAFRTQFNIHKSDINLHIEDDVLIGPDALAFVEACYPHINGDVGSVSLVGYVYDEPRPTTEDGFKKAFKSNWFNCGWGWATTKKFYQDHFSKAEDINDPNSWAKNILNLYQKEGFCELRTFTRRSKNIGKKGNTNWVRNSDIAKGGGSGYNKVLDREDEEYLNCFDVKEEWTGQEHSPVWEFDFSEL